MEAQEIQELKEATDRLAIHELIARYAWTFDEGDVEGFVNLFTEDGIFESNIFIGKSIKGRETVRAFCQYMQQVFAKTKIQIRHRLTNIVIDSLGGGKAKARYYLLDVMSNPDDPTKTPYGGVVPFHATQGVYKSEMVKVNGKWLFSRVNVISDNGTKVEYEI
ncbi:MAG: nuclear transport factor 2 family protein [Deltaproteobacteria bacterium]|nr:nuclear transport factor 2 family protein [Deltaproteobacteria bacterium]